MCVGALDQFEGKSISAIGPHPRFLLFHVQFNHVLSHAIDCIAGLSSAAPRGTWQAINYMVTINQFPSLFNKETTNQVVLVVKPFVKKECYERVSVRACVRACVRDRALMSELEELSGWDGVCT